MKLFKGWRALWFRLNVEEKQEHWYEEFLWALRQGVIPAGRIISNAGAQKHKTGPLQRSIAPCQTAFAIPWKTY